MENEPGGALVLGNNLPTIEEHSGKWDWKMGMETENESMENGNIPYPLANPQVGDHIGSMEMSQ
jgi:hypothetical protein